MPATDGSMLVGVLATALPGGLGSSIDINEDPGTEAGAGGYGWESLMEEKENKF